MTAVVTIAYRNIPHYRAPFYEQLRRRLDGEGIRLRLLAGDPDASESTRRDTTAIEWAETLPRRSVNLVRGSANLEWQGALKTTLQDDLLILEDAVRLTSNSACLARRAAGIGPKVALWGHGQDLQKGEGRAKAALRRWHHRACDWYFAYTESVAQRVAANGVPKSRITDVRNTIDTAAFAQHLGDVTEERVAHFRSEIGASDKDRIALYCGGLHRDKRLSFLLESCKLIAQQLPTFKLVVIGAGPEQSIMVEAANRLPWLYYLGPRFGIEKAVAYRVSDLVLMPGVVGLVIVDAHVARRPLVTTADAKHGPEIDYLDSGTNGLILAKGSGPRDYANEVLTLLADDRVALIRLAAGSAHAAAALSMESMVDRFAGGIIEALNSHRCG